MGLFWKIIKQFFILTSLILLVLSSFLLNTKVSASSDLQEIVFQPTDEDFMNPERGLYGHMQFFPTGYYFVSQEPWSNNGPTAGWTVNGGTITSICNGKTCWLWEWNGSQGGWANNGRSIDISQAWSGQVQADSGGILPWSNNGPTAGWTVNGGTITSICNGKTCWLWEWNGSQGGWANNGRSIDISQAWSGQAAHLLEFVQSNNFGEIRNIDNRSLAHLYLRLDQFRNSDIPVDILNEIDRNFNLVREARIKVILRFVYNLPLSDEEMLTSQDASKQQIFRHLDQLKPILEKNADIIAVMPAGFIGAWGEWHHSSNNLETLENRRTILDKILETLPLNRTVQIRYPFYKKDIFNGDALTQSKAFNGSNLARVGHQNDCFLAYESDGGTYPGNSQEIEQWKDYVAGESRFAPVGGETCLVTSRSNCTEALNDLGRMHWSFLNGDWHEATIDRLKSQGCWPEISKKLGYRFVFKRLEISKEIKAGGVIKFHLELENEGFAAPFNQRPVYLVLQRQSGSYRHNFLLDFDPRHWLPGNIINLDANLVLPANLPMGKYNLFLWLPDASETLGNIPEYAIRMANENTWQSSSGFNLLYSGLQSTLPFDFNNDDIVDAKDIKILLQNWGYSFQVSETDINADGKVNGLDFGEMIR